MAFQEVPVNNLIGLGLYTPAEAGRLLSIPAGKITRWLRGHRIGEKAYERLWSPQIELEDGRVYLGFRDLMEARIADRLITLGISPQQVRTGIHLAREVSGEDRPLSTDSFRTDGRQIFLQLVERDEHGRERERLLNLFRRQYEFRQIVEPILKTIDFDEQGAPSVWWPRGRDGQIVVDPARAFGQPIDAVTSVPTAILAAAARFEDIQAVSRRYEVPPASVTRAVAFEASMETRRAA